MRTDRFWARRPTSSSFPHFKLICFTCAVAPFINGMCDLSPELLTPAGDFERSLFSIKSVTRTQTKRIDLLACRVSIPVCSKKHSFVVISKVTSSPGPCCKGVHSFPLSSVGRAIANIICFPSACFCLGKQVEWRFLPLLEASIWRHALRPQKCIFFGAESIFLLITRLSSTILSICLLHYNFYTNTFSLGISVDFLTFSPLLINFITSYEP